MHGPTFTLNRFYSSQIGRFTSPDPYRARAVGSPQNWNRYSYVHNDPVNFVDPLGLYEQRAGCGAPGSDYCIADDTGLGDIYGERGLIGYDAEGGGAVYSPLPQGQTGPATAVSESEPCDISVPDEPNTRAALALVAGEATAAYRIGQATYRPGDNAGHPTGSTIITAGEIEHEAGLMVSVLLNNAQGFGKSVSATDELKRHAGWYVGYTAGQKYVAGGDFGLAGSHECDRMQALLSAVTGVMGTGPLDSFVSGWRSVIDPETKHARDAVAGRIWVGDTVFRY